MTNFIYNMQDELFHLPLEDFSTIKKLVDHIEAQGKQLRELNKGITKKNATIEKYERENKDLQERNSCLYKKVVELNNGIRNSEDLTWKQKYEALLHSSEQAIGALQKKCQEYKNAETDATTSTIKTLAKENNELEEKVKHLDARIKELIILCDEEYDKNKKLERSNLDLGDTIGLYVEDFKKLKEDLEKEKQVSKDLNAIINSKNKLLDEYMTKCNNLERENKELKEEVNLYIGLCNTKHEEVKALAKAVRCPWGDNAEIISVKTARIKELEAKVKDLEAANEKLLAQDRVRNCVISLSSELNTKIDNQSKEITRLLKNQETLKAEMVNKEQIISSLDATINHKNKLLNEYMTKCNNLEHNNAIFSGKVKEINNLAESIVMLCDDEE